MGHKTERIAQLEQQLEEVLDFLKTIDNSSVAAHNLREDVELTLANYPKSHSVELVQLERWTAGQPIAG